MAPCALAQPNTQPPVVYEEVLVTGGAEAIRTLSGSASFIDEEAIKKFDATDLNELLGQVPGIYIRFEDGYGLRPNIGIRGATSERSQKITMMEDGILITPAPYSAPAAYYVPNVNRMSAVEVFKGPAAIEYGPHTVGGALNFVTASTAANQGGYVDLAYGNDEYRKARVIYGASGERVSFYVDALHYGAAGFKKLDSGGDTGFERNDINARIHWESGGDGGALAQQLDVKVGYADEDSDETYLGLTETDFAQQSDRRYIASELDSFKSEHRQIHLLHSIEFSENFRVFTSAYANRFDRSWNKYDGFIGGADPSLVLAFPDIFLEEIALLRGEVDSNPADEDTIIDVTNNEREYGSQGIESRLSFDFDAGAGKHKLAAGVRFHHDYVERDHKVRGYLVVDSSLQSDGLGERRKKALNKAETDAWSVFINDEINYDKLKISLGARYEKIKGSFDNKLSGVRSNNSSDIWLPGIGAFYQLTDKWGLLAGINKGFSPAGPSAASSVKPEESINYEYGVRYTGEHFEADVIGFFSDYSNLLGRCRASDAGCEVGQEFNGGAVEISGGELTLSYTGSRRRGFVFPVKLAYTYTETAFQSSFQSGFSQWGFVRQGDELPYTPEHQGRLQFGVSNHVWSIDAALKYTGKMRERPGLGDYTPGAFTRSLLTLGIAASYDIGDSLTVRLVGENITDENEIVSRRPFGARPNQPRTIRVGVNYRF